MEQKVQDVVVDPTVETSVEETEKKKTTKKKKMTKVILIGITALFLVGGIVAAIIFGRTPHVNDGFDGVGVINDSIELSADSSNFVFDIQSTVAISSAITTQAPITGITEFQRVFNQNVESSTVNSSETLVIPTIKILFRFNSSNVENVSLIDEFIAAYSMTNKESTILVEGFGCNIGSVIANDKISKLRANSVAEKIIGLGIPADKIEIKWYGKSRNDEFKYDSNSEYRCVLISIK